LSSSLSDESPLNLMFSSTSVVSTIPTSYTLSPLLNYFVLNNETVPSLLALLKLNLPLNSVQSETTYTFHFCLCYYSIDWLWNSLFPSNITNEEPTITNHLWMEWTWLCFVRYKEEVMMQRW
jgi:hypothetical protein